MKTEKTVLFYDDILYEIFLKNKASINECVKRMKKIHDKALGVTEVKDFVAFIKDPCDYIINEYWNMYCSSMPQHLNKATIFKSQTGISIGTIQAECDFYNSAITVISRLYGKDRSPKCTKKCLVFSTTRNDYARYLDESKREHYEALKSFIDSVDTLIALGNTQGVINIVRFEPALQIENGRASINLTKFATEL